VEYVVVEHFSGDELILIRLRQPTPGIWKIIVYNESSRVSSYNIWLPMERFLKPGTTFLQPQSNNTLCEPANTDNVMVVNAYNHYDNSIFLNASRGFTASGQVKPDLAAPGVNIFGPVPGGGYGRMTGSSVAAAHGAGCAALMLEWGIVRGNDPYMQSIAITNYLIRGARRSEIVYPNREWGFGAIDIYGAFEEIYI
jgi:subtilisin family serine protease